MVFPILGANSATGGYEVSNSLRFNDGDSAHLDNTFSSTTNRQTYTYSTWIKRGVLDGAKQHIFGVYIDSSNHSLFRFDDGENLDIRHNLNNDVFQLDSTMLFRDVSAWYHIVISTDTTQSTDSNRIKVYVNGTQISLSGSYPTQNKNTYICDNRLHTIGEVSSGSEEFDGYMAETHFVDGSALAQTDFGEFDSNGVWVPKQYTGSHGTNGFYLEFKQTGTSANSSGIGADTSGNDNHWTPTNLTSIDITEDTCTNNFAVCNFLSGKGTDDLTNGNLVLDADSSGDIVAPSTIGFSSGKWYMEMKSTITAGHGNRKTVGVYDTDSDINHPRGFSSSIPYNGVVVDLRNGSAYESADDGDATDISSFSNNDICGLAYDADNGLLYVYKNGSAQNSGNAINAGNALDTSKTYAFYIGQDGGSTNNGELFCNFGNPSFSISSGNNDGKYGNFEYAPPSGYYALCTKRLAEFG